MKRSFSFVLMLLLVFFAGCKEDNDGPGDMIWDFVNYSIYFSVRDANGINLLDPTAVGNILGNGITIEYKGKVFPLKDSEIDTRFNMPRSLALRKSELLKENKSVPVLSFGEFSPEYNYQNESFTINWGDGTKDVVQFDLYITWKKQEPTVHRTLHLNDKVCDNNSFLIEIVK